MKQRREQTVKLVVPAYNKEQEFGIKHAERLLNMGERHNGGWILPVDSEYIYDKENGIRYKSDKRAFE